MAPDPPRCIPKALEAGVVANNPVIPVVAPQLLRELVVLFPDGKVQMFATPFRQREKRTFESALRRLPFHHPYASLGSSPVMGEPQKVECPWGGGFPPLDVGVARLGRFKPHQARLLRVDRQTVLAHPLG